MRIAMVSQTYDWPVNGQGVFTIHLAEGLARRGHDILVITPSRRVRAYHASHNQVQIQTVPAVPFVPGYPEALITVTRPSQIGHLLDQFKPHVVHLQDHYPLCRNALQAANARGLPVIGTNHFLPENMSHYIPILSVSQSALRPILWWHMLSMFRQLPLITTPTETAADILRQAGIPGDVHAITCGVDLERFCPMPGLDRAAWRRRYHPDPQRTVLLFVGRLSREKRLEVLLRALRRANRHDVQLALVGQGRDWRRLHRLAHGLRLGEQVVFLGYVPDEDLPALLNSVDLFVMPSEAELQSIATLEAMASGKPVLAANARALPELVRNGVNGYLFRAGDVEDAARYITRLADERSRWADMGAAARSMAQRHSLNDMVQSYEAVYRGLVHRMAMAGAVRWPEDQHSVVRM